MVESVVKKEQALDDELVRKCDHFTFKVKKGTNQIWYDEERRVSEEGKNWVRTPGWQFGEAVVDLQPITRDGQEYTLPILVLRQGSLFRYDLRWRSPSFEQGNEWKSPLRVQQ